MMRIKTVYGNTIGLLCLGSDSKTTGMRWYDAYIKQGGKAVFCLVLLWRANENGIGQYEKQITAVWNNSLTKGRRARAVFLQRMMQRLGAAGQYRLFL